MIFARDMKEIADVANERKKRELKTALQSIYDNLVSEVEEKIKIAAEKGLYGVLIGDLYDKMKLGVGRQLVEDGYNLPDIVRQLADMVTERFRECEFNVEKDDDYYCVYITWDKKPPKYAIGRENRI